MQYSPILYSILNPLSKKMFYRVIKQWNSGTVSTEGGAPGGRRVLKMDRPPEPEDSLCHRLRGKGGTKYQRGNGWWCRNGAAPRPGFRRFKRFCPLAAGRFRGCGIVLWDDKFYMPLRGIKTIQPGCARGKCTPSAYGTSPGGGGLLSASLSANLSHSLLSAAKTSPSGVHSEHIL